MGTREAHAFEVVAESQGLASPACSPGPDETQDPPDVPAKPSLRRLAPCDTLRTRRTPPTCYSRGHSSGVMRCGPGHGCMSPDNIKQIVMTSALVHCRREVVLFFFRICLYREG